VSTVAGRHIHHSLGITIQVEPRFRSRRTIVLASHGIEITAG
jgi:hypothetical protein